MVIYEVRFTTNPPEDKLVFSPEVRTLKEWLEDNPELVFVNGRIYFNVHEVEELGAFVERNKKSIIIHRKSKPLHHPVIEIYNDYRE